MKKTQVEINGVTVEFVSNSVNPGDISLSSDLAEAYKNAKPVLEWLANKLEDEESY